MASGTRNIFGLRVTTAALVHAWRMNEPVTANLTPITTSSKRDGLADNSGSFPTPASHSNANYHSQASVALGRVRGAGTAEFCATISAFRRYMAARRNNRGDNMLHSWNKWR